MRWDADYAFVFVSIPGEKWKHSSRLMATAPKAGEPRLTLAFYDQDWPSHSVVAKQASCEALRQQVRDFIKWLKAQGVV